MAEQLEITLKFGDKIHSIVLKDGDAEAVVEVRQAIDFIVNLFVSAAGRKRAQPKPTTTVVKTSAPTTALGPGGAK